MRRYIYSICLVIAVVLSSCSEWLHEPSPGSTELKDFFTVGETAIQSVNAAYAPLMWEYNHTYYSEWFIGDVMSDDALKGGQNIGDMADAYDMENWKTNTNNTLILDFYRAQYQGIARCNLALKAIPDMDNDSTLTIEVQNRLLGELHYLRAYYYFRLVRVYGGVPIVTEPLESADKWRVDRSTVAEVYRLIEEDLVFANNYLWVKSAYSAEDLGRATKGAAQAMLLKVNLYQHKYTEAKQWGDSIIASGEYQLCDMYADNFTLAGENGVESVFEIQYMEDPTSDYGEGNGFSRGTFTTILTRSRSAEIGGGWGFNKPTQNLYDEYEENDPRRDWTIFNPTDAQITTPAEEIYLGSRYLNRKTMWIDKDNTIPELTHNSRGPLNYKLIRYADVLLMYAEACIEIGDLSSAQIMINQVRQRARNEVSATYPDALPDFPYGTYAVTKEDLIKAVRHERRVELGMEGHRWFDLCRWGIAKETMDAYQAGETEEAKAHMAVFIEGKHELLPIPSKEIELNPMQQNFGY